MSHGHTERMDAPDSRPGATVEENVRFEFRTTPPLEHAVRVVAFSGREALSTLYRFEIEVVGLNADFALDDLLERRATLRLEHVPHVREIHGVVVEVQHDTTRGRLVHTHFTVVPELWLLDQQHRSRIFQQKTTQQIVDAMLASNGAYAGRVEWRLADANAYPQRDYCVQYRESDFAFIARLLEDDGIYYFFEHVDGEPERLVFTDNNRLHEIEGGADIDYVEDVGMHPNREHIARIRLGASSRPGASMLRDYDPLRPRLDLTSTGAADRERAREFYDHPGGYTQQGEGRRRARARLEALRATRVLATGEGLVTRLVPGRIFSLRGHPRGEFDQRYAIWDVEHEGHAPEETDREGLTAAAVHVPYVARFGCTPATAPIRVFPHTPRPRVHGSHTARVVGPAGEEVFVDEHARIKVQFYWDREGANDEHSSCWLRVAQSWAGAGWGGLIIPRIGMEVVVDFLEGDPDRPLVTGCVYNGVNPPPNPLPSEKTRSTFRTNSSPGGAGFNEFTFEDLAGNEFIYLRAQKDLQEHVLHDHSTRVDHDQTQHVGHDQRERVDNVQDLSVGVDRHKDVGNDETIVIGANRTTEIGANEVYTIGANREGSVGANEVLSVAADRQRTVGANEAVRIGASQALEVASQRSTQIGANDSLSIGGSHSVSVHGAQQTNVHGALSTSTHAHEAHHVNAGRTTQVKRFDQTMVIGSQSTQVVGPYSLVAMASADVSVVKTKISLRPTTAKIVSASSIILKCGSAMIKLEPGKITLDNGAGASIVLDGAVTNVHGAPVKLN